MGNNMNPMIFLQMIKQGQNPQQLMMNYLQNQMAGTPMGDNLINMIQSGRGNEIEQLARNYMKQNGRDFDKEFNAFRNMWGI